MVNTGTETYTLKNDNNVEVTFMSHGGRILSINVPDSNGNITDVVVGKPDVHDAMEGDNFFGALCGRYSNRIVKGQFELEGTKYQLAVNNGPNHLHGGNSGFNNKIWEVTPIEKTGCTSAYKLTTVSADGEENYPGELSISVIYSLNNENEFKIEYEAQSTKTTIINLTSHSYFNLNGAGKGKILNHTLQVNAEEFTPLSEEIGTVDGTIKPVSGTAMDFTTPKTIGEAVNSNDEQIKIVDGIDHNFVVKGGGKDVTLAATLTDPESGRKMEVYTDQPGIQIYTGIHFNDTEPGKNGTKIQKYEGVALETQIYPDSPNKDHFPDATLKEGDTYKHTCIYKFIS